MSVQIMASIIQHCDGYDILGAENGDLYYRLNELPNILFNTGESVIPDELADYLHESMTLEKILDLCDLGLYTDRRI